MTRHQVRPLIIDVQQVQIEVQEQATGVLRIHFELLHRVDGASIDVEQLVVDETVEQLEVNTSVALDFAQHARQWLPCRATSLDIFKRLTPPVEASLANAALARDLPRTKHLEEEGIDGEVVWAY